MLRVEGLELTEDFAGCEGVILQLQEDLVQKRLLQLVAALTPRVCASVYECRCSRCVMNVGV